VGSFEWLLWSLAEVAGVLGIFALVIGADLALAARRAINPADPRRHTVE
jgi:hypothetical protein